MQQRVFDFLNVDLGRLNVAGWLLMLASFGIIVGGVVFFVAVAQGDAAVGPALLPRWAAYLSWVAAALFFFGGRWALEALAIGIYRHSRESKQQGEPDRESVAQQRGHDPRGLSAAGRITLAIACSLIAVGFGILAALYGEYFPKGPWPFYGLAAFCALIALACLAPRSRWVALRMIGAVLFTYFALRVSDCYGGPDFWRTLAGFGVFGLPAGYVAVTGKYPRWGRLSAVFGGAPPAYEDRREQSTLSDPKKKP